MERTRWVQNLDSECFQEREPRRLWKDISWNGWRHPHGGATKKDFKDVETKPNTNNFYFILIIIIIIF